MSYYFLANLFSFRKKFISIHSVHIDIWNIFQLCYKNSNLRFFNLFFYIFI